jgi:hypothetical protein
MKTIKQKLDKKKLNYTKTTTKTKTKTTTKTKKQFLYNPKNPKKSLDLFTNDNPEDTIHIKYNK